MRRLFAGTVAFGLLAAVAPATAETASPYAGWQAREIKALSSQQVEDLQEGRGMGLALSAELNGYPGPRHVLDLGDDLQLSPAQRFAFEALFAEMQAAAQRLGAEILAREAALEQDFRGGGSAGRVALHPPPLPPGGPGTAQPAPGCPLCCLAGLWHGRFTRKRRTARQGALK